MLSIIFKAGRFIFLFFTLSTFASSIIENKGQVSQLNSEQILYYTSIEGGTVYFLKDRISLVINEQMNKTLYNNVCIGNKVNVLDMI